MLNHPIRAVSLSLALAAMAACSGKGNGAASDVALPPIPADVHSHARPDEARVTHVSLDITPDFATRRISGTARLSIEKSADADSVVLDIRDLDVTRVTDAAGRPLGFTVGTSREFMGAPLAIALPATGDTIVVEYSTSPDAAAVQWLSPSQTAGGKLPFMFTQGQAILTRTWVPTQDGPGIRQTYDAVVRVPQGMRAVMSAESVGAEPGKDEKGLSVYTFRMPHAIPPYLIALAVGDLAFRAIGSNTGVYAEPSVVERAASEFVEVDQMIEAAEKLYGPYRWGRYDLLVLPPAFPFGGMENPMLTFATPTILAGDRSLVSLVAHELAHSWSGNLVTNATWDDFWLNEGFTSYIEARIMEELRGKPYADMLRQLGRQDMLATVEELGTARAADTRLRLDLAGRNPDDGMTDIAYEKGAAFLYTVESVAGRDRLDRFLRQYFDNFAFKPMSSERMVAYMRQNLLTDEEATRINVQQWIFEPGVPANIPPVQSAAFAAVQQKVDAWKGGAPASTLDVASWSTHEWLHFLRSLPDTISQDRIAELDRTFGLSTSGNSEILFAWFRKAIANRYEPAFPALERFLLSQGRRKFVAPLFADLAATPWGKTMATSIYRRARPMYHSVSTGTIDRTLGWPAGGRQAP
ncbi:MAG: M1 family metallopeptidase [Gemmatimonadaceae bacterium]